MYVSYIITAVTRHNNNQRPGYVSTAATNEYPITIDNLWNYKSLDLHYEKFEPYMFLRNADGDITVS